MKEKKKEYKHRPATITATATDASIAQMIPDIHVISDKPIRKCIAYVCYTNKPHPCPCLANSVVGSVYCAHHVYM